MARWIPCGGEFPEGDVIRWYEHAWKRKARKSDRSKTIGVHRIRGQVLGRDGEWVRVQVEHCETLQDAPGEIDNIEGGEVVRRRASTLEQGDAERMLWSDESARAVVTSRFMGISRDDAQPPQDASPHAGRISPQARWQDSADGKAPRRRPSSRSRRRGRAPKPRP